LSSAAVRHIIDENKYEQFKTGKYESNKPEGGYHCKEDYLMIILELLDHMALLTALVVISGHIGKRWSNRKRNYILQGTLFGLVAVIGMLRPLVLAPGLIFDGRSVIISLSGLFFGPVAAIVAGSMAAAARISIGGVGAVMGILVIVSSALIGIFFYYRRLQEHTGIDTAHLLGIGFLVHIIMLGLMITLPGGIGLIVIQQVGMPVILIYPLMTVIIGQFLSDQVSRHREQSELGESEERFRQLVEMGPDAIFVHTDYKIVYLNKSALNLMGGNSKETLIGRSAVDWTLPDQDGLIHERIRTLYVEKQAVPTVETKYRRMDGTLVDVEATAVPIRYEGKDSALVYVRDITERKKQEQEKLKNLATQRQQQKMEAIGVLASGVAHEINNPIMGIMNYAQLIIDDETINNTSSPFAQEIMMESQRVASIVKDLLHFSRIEKRELLETNPTDIIHQATTLMKAVMQKDAIRIETSIKEQLPSIWCRSQQIQQVLVNLLTNARDALNEKYPLPGDENKSIRISCQSMDLDGLPWIRLMVEDHGNGISEDIRHTLYDPFSTTKPKELGTGLGLAVSYGIVEEHQGRLHFETEAGSYTRFYVDLPVSRMEVLNA
jgi:PAS domain S-box-containing protein